MKDEKSILALPIIKEKPKEFIKPKREEETEEQKSKTISVSDSESLKYSKIGGSRVSEEKSGMSSLMKDLEKLEIKEKIQGKEVESVIVNQQEMPKKYESEISQPSSIPIIEPIKPPEPKIEYKNVDSEVISPHKNIVKEPEKPGEPAKIEEPLEKPKIIEYPKIESQKPIPIIRFPFENYPILWKSKV